MAAADTRLDYGDFQMIWKPWLHGLASAVIGGGANSISMMVIDPKDFNLHDGLGKVLSVWVVSGVINAALYLKQSPLPTMEGE